MKIWCLFSIANNYDQPRNNLVRWWSAKPTIEELARVMGSPLGKADDEEVVRVLSLWKGQEVRFPFDDSDYRIQEVAEGDAP